MSDLKSDLQLAIHSECTCGHEGLSLSWHLFDCPIKFVVVTARRVAAAPEIWWCEEHEAPDYTPEHTVDLGRTCLVENEWGTANSKHCRMVRKLLVDI